MKRLIAKDKTKYLNLIARHRLNRKTKYFRRSLHINGNDTSIKIIRIKSSRDFLYEIKGLKELNANECFYVYHILSNEISKWLLNVKDSDIVFTETKTNKVISINENPQKFINFINVWIFKKHTVEFLKISIDDVVFTR